MYCIAAAQPRTAQRGMAEQRQCGAALGTARQNTATARLSDARLDTATAKHSLVQQRLSKVTQSNAWQRHGQVLRRRATASRSTAGPGGATAQQSTAKHSLVQQRQSKAPRGRVELSNSMARPSDTRQRRCVARQGVAPRGLGSERHRAATAEGEGAASRAAPSLLPSTGVTASRRHGGGTRSPRHGVTALQGLQGSIATGIATACRYRVRRYRDTVLTWLRRDAGVL